MKGTIIQVNETRGYGFIQSVAGAHVHVALHMLPQSARESDHVEFDERRGAKGRYAVNVRQSGTQPARREGVRAYRSPDVERQRSQEAFGNRKGDCLRV